MGYIEEGSSGNLDGAFGSILQDFHQSMFRNVSFVLEDVSNDTHLDENSDANSQKTNENSFMDLFMRNEADVLGIQIEYKTISKYLTPSCPVIHHSGAALHTPRLEVTNQNVLNTLHVFSLTVISGIFVSVALLAIFLKVTRKINFIDCTLTFAKCLINQANFNAGLLKAKAIIMLWLICSFLLMEIYEQAINVDMVSFDYSHFVESVMDVDRHKYYALIFGLGDPILDHFKWSTDSVKKRLWKRKNKSVYQVQHAAVLRKFDEDEVYIGSWENLIGTGEYLCGRNKHNIMLERRKYLIATKGFGSAIVGFQYRSNLPESLKREIWHRNLKIDEVGVAQNLAKKCSKPITEMSPDSTPACLCYAKEDLYDDMQTLGPIRSEDMASLFAIFGLLWALSVAAFLAELLSNGIKVLRRRNSNTITPFVRSDSLQSHLSEMILPSHSQCIKLPTTDPTLKPGTLLNKQTKTSEDVSGKNLDDQLEVVSVNEESDE